MPTQTFEQWQGTATRMAVKGSPFEDDWNLQENGAVEIICYNWDGNMGCDGYIEVHKYYSIDPMTQEPAAFSAYYLILERDEYISFHLSELERKLYDWIISEGALNTKEEDRKQNIEIDIHNINLDIGAYLAEKYNPESGDIAPEVQISFDIILKKYLEQWHDMNNVWKATYNGPDRNTYARERMMKQREEV